MRNKWLAPALGAKGIVAGSREDILAVRDQPSASVADESTTGKNALNVWSAVVAHLEVSDAIARKLRRERPGLAYRDALAEASRTLSDVFREVRDGAEGNARGRGRDTPRGEHVPLATPAGGISPARGRGPRTGALCTTCGSVPRRVRCAACRAALFVC